MPNLRIYPLVLPVKAQKLRLRTAYLSFPDSRTTVDFDAITNYFTNGIPSNSKSLRPFSCDRAFVLIVTCNPRILSIAS